MKGELIILSTVSDIEIEEWVKMDALNMDSLPFLWPRASIRSILAVEEKATIYSPGPKISPTPIVAQR